ncbi:MULTISPECIES: hypothetical protein [Pseudomonas syringae group]|uniref:hypothetical protein n=1 Tax=Pseudomonas syringae group TaxID=136849 RepID=UPI0003F99F1E|nr:MULTISPECIES: hypothetical protein [Pseudomonas syringae group]MDU8417053.1 hypothetical protein [Pseudomonas syringae]QIQ73202.1 hypothetical protein HBB04_03604 [Pseudomonas coronafaciens]QQQ49742.1 hypothetical protein JJQ97_20735 [Pseudomonas syringae]
MSTLSQGPQLHLRTEFESLGERLIRFGQALQDPATTVGQLTGLANSCGIALKLRTVAESGARDDEG